jgi:AraC-like DNA-binding protein
MDILSSPQLYYALSQTVSKNNYYPKHVHGYYEILIILNGKGKFLIEGVEYPFESDSIFLLPPSKYHVMTKLPESNYERITIYFNGEHLPSFINSGIYNHKIMQNQTKELVLKFLSYQNKYSKEIINELIIGFINELLLIEFYNETTKTVDNFVSPLVKKAIEYINNNIDKPLNTKIIADALFVSHTHLGHAFSSAMNVGIMHYVQIKKVYRAKELIKQGYPSTTVAEMLGYKSYPTFIRNYKTYLNTNPSNDKP